jgi:type II secretory pathway component PulF
MLAVGLLSPPEVRLLATAEKLGNRPWVLHQLAEAKRRRTQWRLARLSEFAMPLAVLLLGVFVLIVALAIFQPLVLLIDSLA